ncbi:MAG: VanZ family protein [Melioribacteraceae bacterium]
MQSNSFLIRLYKYFSSHKITVIYIPLIVYWITLFILTTIPADNVPQLFENQDKYEHFIAYCGLAILLSLALYFQKRSILISSKAFLFALLFILAYGAVDELHQIFIPGRYCDFYDWLADSSGGILGIGIVFLFVRKISKNYSVV